MGKTNAQNEAQKKVTTEFLVMTDANSILDSNSIIELMASYTSKDIVYVTGLLKYTNAEVSDTSESESTYWNLDIKIREIESKLQTITAGNGALYSIRNSEYIDFNPIESHDSSMPTYYALKGKRAISNSDALAYEKAGENTQDEFKRKVRMNRGLLRNILPSLKILNIFKYRWFSYFYLGHRTSRYLLWLAHLLLLVSNFILALKSGVYRFFLLPHVLFWIIALFKHFRIMNVKLSILVHYYATTIIAQWVGVINSITGRAKPYWEKAESTR